MQIYQIAREAPADIGNPNDEDAMKMSVPTKPGPLENFS